MATDGALIALIVDDRDALLVLAAWAALGPALIDVEERSIVVRLANLAGVGETRAERALQKLLAVRVLVDGGISDLADRMLQQMAHNRIHGTQKRGKR